MTIVQQQMYSGPLPHPDVLTKYNDAVSDGAERILKMAEAQSAHRIKQEHRVIGSNIRAQTLGVVFAFILGMTAVIGGVYMVMSGKDITGIVSILTGVIGLAGSFLIGKSKQNAERAAKN